MLTQILAAVERFGIPKKLIAGFLTVAVFMTGDGFELTFLTKYMVDHGFSAAQGSLLITVYGLFAAIAGWTAGVLAEMFGARRIMLIGACWWIGVHLVFLGIALPSGVYPFILAVYALRGFGYPLFIYSFMVLLAQTVRPERLASATGLFWTCFSLGLGVFGAYIPSFLIPAVGEYRTFWFAIPFSVAGLLLCLLMVPRTRDSKAAKLTHEERVKELAEGVTIAFHNPGIAVCGIIRMINSLLLYGFPVIMPLYLCGRQYGGDNWFPVQDWMRIWGCVFIVMLFFNVFWGWFMDRFGWVWPMRWFGCALLAICALSFYYAPRRFGANAPLMVLAAVFIGVGTSAFASIPAIMNSLVPEKRGAALSVYNLSAGLATFVGPGIATLLLSTVGIAGICWTYAVLYVAGAALTYTLRPKQPGLAKKPAAVVRTADAKDGDISIEAAAKVTALAHNPMATMDDEAI
ncbi:MFS transporter [Bifidobacterium sp. SMB2]|uniref:MFS transporter n=1 Tax=Bifidobacterium saimiriisciurei TaxID=2661627 RepID=A0ABX0C8M2_9BIFI|nr:MFS transporter [Bifidobacterium sp. SMB2]NEG96513.1 MFS transporter [Bifidobacterium sp. SMB2]NEH10570.1 MFS transporter [Bifidobacterium saimiriisciurei]NEH10647.1 MFS transporter [Bifidobacterium saimiriisciurei]